MLPCHCEAAILSERSESKDAAEAISLFQQHARLGDCFAKTARNDALKQIPQRLFQLFKFKLETRRLQLAWNRALAGEDRQPCHFAQK